jgi:hypothetical protein
VAPRTIGGNAALPEMPPNARRFSRAARAAPETSLGSLFQWFLSPKTKNRDHRRVEPRLEARRMAKPPLLVIVNVNGYKPQAVHLLWTNDFTAKTASTPFKRFKRHPLSPCSIQKTLACIAD